MERTGEQLCRSDEARLKTLLKRNAAREDWFGWIQQFLEERIADAPDETCRAVAQNLWQETADFTDDD